MKVKRWFKDLYLAQGFAEGVEYVNDSAVTVLDIVPEPNERHEMGWAVLLNDEDAEDEDNG